ncbi:trehalose operon repressor [Sporosarcina sp. Marseille-Q4063]|uniref:trehalose operon repressor n=1 Tax=Sporosarcina sp. Marseille-Q4063 TaxID=2810514 RepID=UPI001BB031E0|nr:trehalose operon repressor [Sporosarcina sp. Marseille-Q4063]QUW22625.1 trehalose operon repressor [Sporosarcina sp. Marseille-Q4063]
MKKYLAIYHDLVDKTKSNYWGEAEMLPSENSLTVKYDVSRETIRKALDLLAQNGYIQKVRGKGSVILNVNKFDFPVSGIVSFKELATNLQIPTKTIVNELSLVEADEKLQVKLDLEPKELVWKVARIREIAGDKVILDKDFFNKSIVPVLTKEACEDSIYEYLENKLNLKISYARKEITVEEPTDEDRELLDLEGHFNIVIIKSMVYLDDTTLFQYTESRHRPDKFQFVDFARRTRN